MLSPLQVVQCPAQLSLMPSSSGAIVTGRAERALTLCVQLRAGRLTGTLLGVKSLPCLPLSPEGQVHRLIGEATDKENLGSMYIWWMPWF